MLQTPVLSRVQSAGKWFAESGIQEPNGGVARYYRADLSTNKRTSTEITGYAVSTFSWLYTRTVDPRYLDRAIAAADFLLRVWNADLKLWPFEYSEDDSDSGHALTYFFDTGIIVRGLLALWRITGSQQLLEACIRGCDSMERHFAAGETFQPILLLPSLEPLPRTSQWSRSPGCYQLKSALAWHDVALVTEESRFAVLYKRALRTALDTHRSFLPAEMPARTMDRLHAYCYFLEAALPAAADAEVQSALAGGIERVAAYLREIRADFVRSDVYAQLLRVRLLASQFAGIRLNRAQAEEEAEAVPTFQIESGDTASLGGYAFGKEAGALIPHTNPVSTAFCMQALEMWDDFNNGSTLDVASLI